MKKNNRIPSLELKKMSGGLNNQKMILLALIVESIEKKTAIKLPFFINYINKKNIKGFRKKIHHKIIYPFKKNVDMFDVFNKATFFTFLEKYNITLSDSRHSVIYSSDELFFKGSEIIKHAINNKNYIYRSLTLDYFKYLTPSAYMENKIKYFTNQSLPYDAVCQLRIEDDWPLEVEDSWENQKKQITTSQIDRSRIILRKIKNTYPDIKTLYITYDKSGLQCNFQDIALMAKKEFELQLKEKHYFNNDKNEPQNILEASMIDFEIAVNANIYIGASTSSFSSLSALTSLCREHNEESSRYFYDTNNDTLLLDNLKYLIFTDL